MAWNIEVEPSGFANFGFGRPEVRYRDHHHSAGAQQASDVAQRCRRIVHVLGHMPEHNSVIAHAIGNQLVEILDPNIEIQNVTGLLRGTGRSLGPTRLPPSTPHVVEKPARATAHIQDATRATRHSLDATDSMPVNHRQAPV
jgi:hypothetical protein